MKSQNHKDIEKAIKLAYSSLMSHLPWTYLRSSEGTNFHCSAIREYAQIILTLSNQYRIIKKKKDVKKKPEAQPARPKNNPS